MIDTICSEFPYYVFIASFVYSMVFERSKRIKAVPSGRSFFARFALCCVVSVLVKYPFNGDRPGVSGPAIPSRWKHSKTLSDLDGIERVVIEPKSHAGMLLEQPKRDVLHIPVSFSQLKNRLLPSTGTPSSHSVVSGYLTARMLESGCNPVLSLCPMIVPVARVVYGHHYVYQVVLGVFVGVFLVKGLHM
ncbi:uncharacterized protein NEMAJ01_2057 [Nematocida major]|uniref:uncharacterized protein n=1 Tax=Nematocida major TaxID=1912982 RepID=UPI0020075A34|nr:uncharacterized protein NEMAJ01_2057 [Nematocida major]KAH9387161.1 hypothetical protein NEMAJ01_2057 [Nematocida major]